MTKPTQWRVSKKWITTTSFIVGVLLLGVLLWQIGLTTLIRDLTQAGPSLFWIVLLSGFRYLLRSIGWAAVFMPEEQRRRSALFGVQVAGDALAYVSLAGPFLGEPLKAALLQDVDISDSLGSTLLENFVYTLTACAVILSGLVMLILLPFTGKDCDTVATPILLCSLLAVCVLIRWQHTALSLILSWIGGKTGRRWRRLGERLEVIVGRMEQVNARRPFALWTIFLFAILAQSLLLAEVALVLWPLGVSLSLASLLIIESATKLAEAAFFFIPGRVGADEGSSAATVALLGMGPSVGLILSLLRRFGAIVWALVGLGYMAYHTGRVRTQSEGSGA